MIDIEEMIEEDQTQEVPVLHTTTTKEIKIDVIEIEEVHTIENIRMMERMKETKDPDQDQTNEWNSE